MVVGSLNYSDPARMTAQDFPAEGGKRYDVAIMDARDMGFTLQQDGFQLLSTEPTAAWQANTGDDDALKELWYPEACAMVKALTGAKSVSVQNHVHRSSAAATGHELILTEAERAGGKHKKVVLNGVDGIHADFTPDSSYVSNLEAKLQHQHEEEQRAAGVTTRTRIRVRVVNIWQSISDKGPIQRKPLALVHPNSVKASELRANYKEMNGNTVWNLTRTPESQHAWWYFNEMKRGEMLVFYGYDEEIPVLHTAFELPNTPAHAPPRESLETRVLCVFEETFGAQEQVNVNKIPAARL